jgi:hypothetical protein
LLKARFMLLLPASACPFFILSGRVIVPLTKQNALVGQRRALFLLLFSPKQA